MVDIHVLVEKKAFDHGVLTIVIGEFGETMFVLVFGGNGFRPSVCLEGGGGR